MEIDLPLLSAGVTWNVNWTSEEIYDYDVKETKWSVKWKKREISPTLYICYALYHIKNNPENTLDLTQILILMIV